ncbi:MAG: hypothetical protein UY92_C0009G0073 [Candidatus Magasanikbacteria bacterium GW2011_GWA2_56_11]|uniref:Uncharacterized protein n=1 Tax=Candidatus Magasanikbacteria bacterium GW2011_GWA2_56_11 TaxID=1619044 RepID=A0A0G2B9X1_9BACT|nr:MAG: hypothetical protein UY92_C0009G0073 [Candidatus Magasanikbacteria bacterium GW2011_GWA2_56_11]
MIAATDARSLPLVMRAVLLGEQLMLQGRTCRVADSGCEAADGGLTAERTVLIADPRSPARPIPPNYFVVCASCWSKHDAKDGSFRPFVVISYLELPACGLETEERTRAAA